MRSVPENLTVNIDLSKIKILEVFSWIKSKNVSDQEMLRTFNCGVGFCIIVKKSNLIKVKNIFQKSFHLMRLDIFQAVKKIKII